MDLPLRSNPRANRRLLRYVDAVFKLNASIAKGTTKMKDKLGGGGGDTPVVAVFTDTIYLQYTKLAQHQRTDHSQSTEYGVLLRAE
jgi:hypothetical protein